MTTEARRKPWYLRRKYRMVALMALAADLTLGTYSAAMAITSGNGAPQLAAVTTASQQVVAWTDGRSGYDSAYSSQTSVDPHDPNQSLYAGSPASGSTAATAPLTVTVGQTTDLTDQGVSVTWNGGQPTPAGGASRDFLQIMQCWAGPSQQTSGPSPQQCQWGTPTQTLSDQTGTNTATRALFPASSSEADPKQSLGGSNTVYVPGRGYVSEMPFQSATGGPVTYADSSLASSRQVPFDNRQSNEATIARSGGDGSGQYIFNLQSALTAPYLGCGDQALAAKGNTCWLVIVPRGEYNLNAERSADQAFNTDLAQNPTYVAGSPLSATAWQDRIQVKLSFSAIGANCKLGQQEVATAGSELVAGAFASWQAPLCRLGTNFSYSQIGDTQVRTNLTSGMAGLPNLGFLSAPIDPSALAGRRIEYAPVTDSAIVVSYLIDKNYTDDASNPDIKADGTLVTNLRLTPLLVAKLLTQSYKEDTPGDGAGKGATVPAGNPDSLRHDPEFLALNPQFQYFRANAQPDGLIVPFGNSDAANLVWNWICSDSASRSFLSGRPDSWGNTVNAAYKTLGICSGSGTSTLDYFPKADASTFRAPTDGSAAAAPMYGSLDLRPYSASFTDGAVRTSTAKAGVKDFWEISPPPAQYKAADPQTPGARFELALTLSQAANLYGVPSASLVPTGSSASDPGIAATAASMATQLSARVQSSVPGFFLPDPGQWVSGGYPLTMQTYAAVNVCAATAADLSAYAKLLTYAAHPGQVPGTQLGELPLQYSPLSNSDAAETLKVATDLKTEATSPTCPHPTTSPTPHPTTSTSASTGGGSITGTGTNTAGGTAPTTTSPARTAASTTSAAVRGDAAPGGITPVADVSAAGQYGLLAALCFALPCLITGPRVLHATRSEP